MPDPLSTLPLGVASLMRKLTMGREHQIQLRHEEELHKKRLEQTRELAEVELQLARQKAELRKPARPSKRTAPSNAVDAKRYRVIREVAEMGYEGQKYCAALGQREIAVPFAWVKEGCPREYSKAYKEPKWRKRIQDEKYRITH